jgi:thiamine biosynthesis lipoprotein
MEVFSFVRLWVMLFWSSAGPVPPDSVREIKPGYAEGKTMGTTYRVIYFDALDRNFTLSIDSLLVLVNRSINTYDPSSEVSAFNRSSKGIQFGIPFLKLPLKKALEVASLTNGAFDPTVMPLVNAWGFGPEHFTLLPDRKIDSLKKFVDYRKIVIENDSVKKSDPRIQLDFGGIGQGYGADVVAAFLKSKGVTNFLVELGGEGVASGKNLQKGSYWKVGILDPNSTRESQFYKAYVTLRDQSFTTAGNYFNYRTINKKKYGHTIDPRTGYPVEHTLLSASVFAHDCTTADAWDTAFMVMGVSESIAFLSARSDLEALLIFLSPEGHLQTYVTPGLKEFIVIEP